MPNDRITAVLESVDAVCKKNGIERDSVEILAATKTVPPSKINELIERGIIHVGENRVREFVEKRDFVHGAVWDFIGALQTNKAKHIVGRTRYIHSLDRNSLADEIDSLSAKLGIVTDALIEVNMGGEATKSGISPKALDGFLDYCRSKRHIRIRGLMSVLPINASEKTYDDLYELFAARRDSVFSVLSAGMSNDYDVAIKHGANLVRLGQCLFGARAAKDDESHKNTAVD